MIAPSASDPIKATKRQSNYTFYLDPNLTIELVATHNYYYL